MYNGEDGYTYTTTRYTGYPYKYEIIRLTEKDYYDNTHSYAGNDRLVFLRGKAMEFRNQDTEVVRLHYIAMPSDLSSDTDLPFAEHPKLQDYGMLIAIRAAKIAKTRDEADISQLQLLENEQMSLLRNTLEPMSSGDSKQIKVLDEF